MSTVQHTFGRATWRESMTTDVEKSKSFYGQLFGWTYKSQDMGPNGPYTLITAGGEKQIGGLWAAPAQLPSAWMTYFSTDDVDGSAKIAAANGGRIMRGPNDIPGVGRFAVIQDPFDAVSIAFKSKSGDPLPGTPQVGEFCWETLVTPDAAKAKAFYSKVYKWVTQSGPGSHVPLFAVDTTPQGQVADIGETRAFPPHWMTYVVVERVETSRDRAAQRGGQVVAPLIEVPTVGRISVIEDPTGATIGLFQPARRA